MRVWVVLHEDDVMTAVESVFDGEAKAEAHALAMNTEEGADFSEKWAPLPYRVEAAEVR